MLSTSVPQAMACIFIAMRNYARDLGQSLKNQIFKFLAQCTFKPKEGTTLKAMLSTAYSMLRPHIPTTIVGTKSTCSPNQSNPAAQCPPGLNYITHIVRPLDDAITIKP